MAKTSLLFPTVLSSTRFCLIKKSKYSFRTLQFTFALYMMCVNFNGPRWANTLRMAMYISSLERLILKPFTTCLCLLWSHSINSLCTLAKVRRSTSFWLWLFSRHYWQAYRCLEWRYAPVNPFERARTANSYEVRKLVQVCRHYLFNLTTSWNGEVSRNSLFSVFYGWILVLLWVWCGFGGVAFEYWFCVHKCLIRRRTFKTTLLMRVVVSIECDLHGW